MPFQNNWVNRTTKQLEANVSPRAMTDRYSQVFVDGSGAPASNANWIYDPDLSAVAGQPNKYWLITGDLVSLMDAAGQAVVDAAEAAALTADTHAELTDEVDGMLPIGVDVRAMLQSANRRANFNTNRFMELRDRVQAMLDSTGGIANMRTDGLAVSISATAVRTLPDAITDYKNDIDAGLAD